MSLVSWPAQGASGKQRALGTVYLYLSVLRVSRGPTELSFHGNFNYLVAIVIYLFFLASNSRYAFAITPSLEV